MQSIKLFITSGLLLFGFSAFAQTDFDPLTGEDGGAGIRANELETDQNFFDEAQPDQPPPQQLPDEVQEDLDTVEGSDDDLDGEDELNASDDPDATDDIVEKALKDSPEQLDKEPLPQIKRKKKRVKNQYRREKQYIEHPFASKGLIKITKDKTYIYKTPESPQNKVASLKMGLYDPTNLSNGTNDFSTIYEDSDQTPMIIFDYEWMLFKGFGRMTFKVGSGVYLTSGKARFENGNEARETVTFLIFPNNAGLVYRLQFKDKQLLVPYAEGGVDVFTFAERRDDDQNPDLGAALGAAYLSHFSFGGQLNISAFSKEAAFNLDREYGINNMYLAGEFRTYIDLGSKFDFSANVINIGLVTEF